jgi:hypothetical protein
MNYIHPVEAGIESQGAAEVSPELEDGFFIKQKGDLYRLEMTEETAKAMLLARTAYPDIAHLVDQYLVFLVEERKATDVHATLRLVK